jgi:archaellin
VQVVVSTAILLIATIIAASVFTGAALSELYTFQNTFKQVGSKNQAFYETSITIIGEANVSAPSTGGSTNLNEIEVWVKNTGTTSFQVSATGDPQYWDVFLTFPNGTNTRYPYSSTCTVAQVIGPPWNPCFNVVLMNGMSGSSWATGDTIQLTIITEYGSANNNVGCGRLPVGSYEVSLSLSNGANAQDSFSI